jgi:hypothetical protein
VGPFGAADAAPTGSAGTVARAGRPTGEQLLDDGRALFGRLALPVHGLGKALTQAPMMVDLGKSKIGEGEATESVYRLVGRAHS